MDYYILQIYGDIEPILHGPFATNAMRDNKAKELRNAEGDNHGYYTLEVSKGNKVHIDCYSNSFFEG